MRGSPVVVAVSLRLVPPDEILQRSGDLIPVGDTELGDHRGAETLEADVVHQRDVVDRVHGDQRHRTIVVPIRLVQMGTVLQQGVDQLK